MNALAISAPNEMCLSELPEPEAGAEDVVLSVRRIGYCGSDLNTFRGLNPLVSYPRVPGHEIAATVESVGRAVPAGIVEIGQDVTVLPYTECGKCAACRSGRFNACKNNQTLGVQREGALTERIAVPYRKIVTAAGLGLAELALVEPLAVGFHAVDRGRVTAEDVVCVIGSGMIGLGAIAAAGLVRGARVIAVDVDDRKLQLALQAGAAEVINSAGGSLHERLLDLTDGFGPSVCIEAVGMTQTFIQAVEEVAYGGRVVYIGYAKNPVSYETKYFLLKELDILGSRGSTRKDFEDVIGLLTTGRYPVAATITKTVGFTEAIAAMHEWSAAPGAITKIQVAL